MSLLKEKLPLAHGALPMQPVKTARDTSDSAFRSGTNRLGNSRYIPVIIVCLFIAASSPAYSQALYGPEYEVKAGFIYNFAKFVEWPDSSFNHDITSFIIGVVSHHSESDVFFSLDGKTVGGKKVVVKKFEQVKGNPLEYCHILFIDSPDLALIREGLMKVKGRSVLTVGQAAGFTEEGGIINFFTEKGSLRFEVNLGAAEGSKLRLSSQLLMSAEIVTKGRR